MQDVARLGRRFDIVTVPKGRGLNDLVPRGLAVEATPDNKKKLISRNKKQSADRAVEEGLFTKAAEQLKSSVVKIPVKANEQGHLFEMLKPDMIIEAINNLGVDLPASCLDIKTPIKTTGDYKIDLVLGDKTASVPISVVPQD